VFAAWLKQNWHHLLSHLAGIAPLVVLAAYYLSGSLANPVRYVILRSGTIGLILLVASLACTPVRIFSGWQGAIQIRRTLGLYGFLFAAIHFGVYLVLENSLYFDLIWRDLGERRAMLIGLIAFLLLVPLALTSTRGWQRRLGKRWKSLHRLVYLALPLTVWHYLWLDRDFVTVPLIYAVVVGLLLLVRLPLVRLAYRTRLKHIWQTRRREAR
jgi:sulfoxide reductase heme-binding subunit YedZ